MTAPGADALVSRDVRPIIDPRSLAIVGASPRNGAAVLGAQRGSIPAWGVNPGRSEVLGLPCVPRIADLPEAVETAMLLVGHERIEAACAEALDAGIRHFIVPGLGSEAGLQAAPTAARLRDRARDAGATMLGPNCMGVAVPDGAAPWLAIISDAFRAGHVAAVSQSGSAAEALTALGPRVGFRAVVSCGGEADLDLADLTAFFALDDRTRAIALFIESVRRPAAFAFALELAAAQKKPVVCLKVGSSQAAARAALAHTGALVGSSRAFSALLARTGALQVDDMPDLVETLEVLGRRRRPAGVRVGAVSESGGEAALLADRGADCGLRFDPLPVAVSERLRVEFPALISPQNPIDAWAAAEPERIFPRSLELLADSGMVDVLLAQVDLSRWRSQEDQHWNRMIVEALGRIAAARGLFAAVTTAHTSDPPDWASEVAATFDLALLRGPSTALGAISRVAGWRPWVPESPAPEPPVAVPHLDRLAGALPEHESCEILERYGVAFAARLRADGAAAAAAAARRLGCPVVVKRDGPAHKLRGGGVEVGLATPEAAAAAATRLGARVLVARQAGPGAELFCGAVRDPGYGSVIAVGRGGVDVERSASPAVVLGPLGPRDAERIIAAAGLPDPDGALAAAAVAVSRLMRDHPQVVEVDINPLIVGAEATVAVDGLVVTAPVDAVARTGPHQPTSPS